MKYILTEKKCAVLPPGTYADGSVKGLRIIVREKQTYFQYRRTIAGRLQISRAILVIVLWE